MAQCVEMVALAFSKARGFEQRVPHGLVEACRQQRSKLLRDKEQFPVVVEIVVVQPFAQQDRDVGRHGNIADACLCLGALMPSCFELL